MWSPYNFSFTSSNDNNSYYNKYFYYRRWWTFTPTKLHSTQQYVQSKVRRISSVSSKVDHYHHPDLRNLYGQVMYCPPYNFENSNSNINSNSNTTNNDSIVTSSNGDIGNHTTKSNYGSGRCILDENVFEVYYRQRGDVPFDTLFDLYKNEYESRLSQTTTRKSLPPTTRGSNLIAYGMDLLQQQKVIDKDSRRNNTLSQADEILITILQYYATIPTWVNIPQIQRGQEIFIQYLPAIGITLYYRSLVPGFSIPKIAAVLLSTGYLAPPASQQQVQQRLFDTGAFLAAISQQHQQQQQSNRSTSSKDTVPLLLEPYSEIWQNVLQVRVLHTKVRHALLHRTTTTQKVQKWDTKLYGIPINQEDLSATLLAFSYNTLLGIEFILGTSLSHDDQLAYLHFWRYIGWLLGIETTDIDIQFQSTLLNKVGITPQFTTLQHKIYKPLDPCGPGWIVNDPSPIEHAYAMFASILLHLSKPDTTSVTVAHHLLQLGGRRSIRSMTQNNNFKKNDDHKVTTSTRDVTLKKKETMWFYFRSYQCRRFIGNELADVLLLPLHPIWYQRILLHIISTIYLCTLRLYTWASVPKSPFRSIIYHWHQKHLTIFYNSWNSKFIRKTTTQSFINSTKSNNTSVTTTDTIIYPPFDDITMSCPFAMVAPPQY